MKNMKSKGGKCMRKISFSLAVILCVIVFAALPLLAADLTPFPKDLNIVPPDKNTVPEKLAEFSGIWEGHWTYLPTRTQLAVIAVERIGKKRALVVYSWGPLESGDPMKGGISKSPGWKRFLGCPVEKAADGNYIITVKFKETTFVLKQTDMKDTIMVTQKLEGGMRADQTAPFSKKK
jgi:hypothetical protein